WQLRLHAHKEAAMKAEIALPVMTSNYADIHRGLHTPAHPARKALPRVVLRERKGPALHSSPLGESPKVLGLNVAASCGQRCAFCSARAYANYPGDEVVYLFSDNVKRLSD